jgi:hypothetical protein
VILSGAHETVIGGSAPAARNVISANGFIGVDLDGTNDSVIKGNYVGTDKCGPKDLGNVNSGIRIDAVFGLASGTTVGGGTAASRNVNSGNGSHGITLDSTQGTRVVGNRIGTATSGTGDLGNDDGVFISGSRSTTILRTCA